MTIVPADDVGAAAPAANKNLRNLALTGGLYLTIREAIGMLVRLAGVAVVTRLIGPADYGAYFGASSFVLVVATAAQMGSELWLIRQREEPTQEDMDEVWTALLVVSVVVTLAALLLSWPASLVVHSSVWIVAFRLLVVSVPINVLWAPAQARIERGFAYRQMAWLELGGDLVLYGVAVPLAFDGFGEYSLVLGYLAWQTFLLVGSLLMARYRPRLRWNPVLVRQLVRHGLGYSSNDWCQRLGQLSATIVVGAISGAAGVGLLGLALRLVDTVGFGLRATWRLGMATLSRLSDDLPRLRRALEQGMVAQAAVLGVPMLALALTSHWVVPLVFGKVWLPSAKLFSIICIGRLASSPAQLQTTLLYMQGRISQVTRGSALSAIVLWVAAVPLTLQFGTLGYAEAVVVSSVGWILVDRATAKVVSFRRQETFVCLAAFIPGLLIPALSGSDRWFLLLSVLLLIAHPRLRRNLIGFASVVLGQMRPGAATETGDARDEGQVHLALDAGDTAPAAYGEPMGSRRAGRRTPRGPSEAKPLPWPRGFVRRRGWVVVALTVLGVGGGFLFGRAAAPAYVADAYAVVNSGASTSGPGSADEADSLATTDASLIPQDNSVVDQVARDLGASPGAVRSALAVSAGYQTAVLDLSYRASTPSVAIKGASDLAETLSSSGLDSSAVTSGSVSVASLPKTAALTSGTSRDAIAFGLLGGLLLGLIAALGWERFDPCIDSTEDLSDVLALPVLSETELAGAGAQVFAARVASTGDPAGRAVVLVPAEATIEDQVQLLAGTIGAAGGRPEVVAGHAPQLTTVGSTPSGAVVLVVAGGSRAKTVAAAAQLLGHLGRFPSWGVLIDAHRRGAKVHPPGRSFRDDPVAPSSWSLPPALPVGTAPGETAPASSPPPIDALASAADFALMIGAPVANGTVRTDGVTAGPLSREEPDLGAQPPREGRAFDDMLSGSELDAIFGLDDLSGPVGSAPEDRED